MAQKTAASSCHSATGDPASKHLNSLPTPLRSSNTAHNGDHVRRHPAVYLLGDHPAHRRLLPSRLHEGPRDQHPAHGAWVRCVSPRPWLRHSAHSPVPLLPAATSRDLSTRSSSSARSDRASGLEDRALQLSRQTSLWLSASRFKLQTRMCVYAFLRGLRCLRCLRCLSDASRVIASARGHFCISNTQSDVRGTRRRAERRAPRLHDSWRTSEHLLAGCLSHEPLACYSGHSPTRSLARSSAPQSNSRLARRDGGDEAHDLRPPARDPLRAAAAGRRLPASRHHARARAQHRAHDLLVRVVERPSWPSEHTH